MVKSRPILSIVCVLISGWLLTYSSLAHANTPFACTGDIYQVQSGQLRIFDPITSQYVDIGALGPSYNAMGFNQNDGFIYALQGSTLIRVASDGSRTEIFDTGISSFSGDVDNASRLWLQNGNRNLSIVDINTQAITDLGLDRAVPAAAADLTFVDTDDGQRIVMVGRSQMALVDPVTGTVDKFALPDLANEGTTGAIWADSLGQVFFFKNSTGNIYELRDYLTTTPSVRLVATGVASSNNDGTSCRSQPFPNLAPIAFDDSFTTPFNTALTANVIVDNGNGMDNDPDGTPVTVSTTPVTPPDNGSVTIAANGDFTYTPDDGFFGTDNFIYQITDGSGITDTATVTIIVERAVLGVAKSSTIYEPASFTGFSLPGNDMLYTITVENSGTGPADSDSVVLFDRMPSNITFYNDDIDNDGPDMFGGSDPIGFTDNGSGLNFLFNRDVRFSNQPSPPSSFSDCNYTPQTGYDPNVTFICFNPKGQMQAASVNPASFSLSFRARIN